MLEPEPTFRPVRRLAGYLPLEDLGVVGDGATVALVGLDGSIPWLCVPAFDAEPLFCALLDQARGGQFSPIGPLPSPGGSTCPAPLRNGGPQP